MAAVLLLARIKERLQALTKHPAPGKFSTLNQRIEGNDADIVLVADKVKVFFEKFYIINIKMYLAEIW
jgi:hypothetical protein